MFKWFKWLITAAVAAVVLFNVYAYGAMLFWRGVGPESTAFMRERMSVMKAEDPEVTLHYQWRPYDELGSNLKHALIASEDASFISHDGFDWNGIRYAMRRNEKNGEVKAGGSTITQQLVKNLFLWEARSYVRKGEEAWLTLLLEGSTDKKRIYEIYLNVIEWGYGVYGAEAASQYYFNRSADRLTKAQAARLASMVTRPRYYDEHRKSKALSNKTNIINRRMNAVTVPK